MLNGGHMNQQYADPDDDKDAMQSRIKTVTDAINKATQSEGITEPNR